MATSTVPLWMKIFFRGNHFQADVLRRNTKRYLRALIFTFNVHTITLAAVACLAVWICDHYQFTYNMDFTLVATGTTFPLVFTISQAFARRERATVLIANLKASVVALYYMHRDWDQTDVYPSLHGNDSSHWAKKVKVVLVELMTQVKLLLTTQNGTEGLAEYRLSAVEHELYDMFQHSVHFNMQDRTFSHRVHKNERSDPGRAYLAEAYRLLSKMSVMNEQLTVKAGYTRGGEGGLSRTNQYFRYIISNIEELRMIRDYRTPVMMRYACGLLFHIFAVILAPYFVHFCDSWRSYGHEIETCPAGYAGSFVYVMIVMLLYHVQQDIENPFDASGLDDVFFDLDHEVDEVTGDRINISRTSTDAGPSMHAHSPGGGALSSHGSMPRNTSSDWLLNHLKTTASATKLDHSPELVQHGQGRAERERAEIKEREREPSPRLSAFGVEEVSHLNTIHEVSEAGTSPDASTSLQAQGQNSGQPHTHAVLLGPGAVRSTDMPAGMVSGQATGTTTSASPFQTVQLHHLHHMTKP